MRRKTLLILFFFILCTSYNQSEEKTEVIGYIDLQYVFENSNLKDSTYKDFLLKKKRLIEQKKRTEEELVKLKNSLDQKKNLIGYSEYMNEKELISETIENYEKQIQEFQKEIKAWEADAMAGVFDEIINVMKIISEEENMPVIISRRAVIYGKFSRDMSQRAIDIINEVNQRSIPSAR